MAINQRAQDISIPGGIVHNPAAPYAREMARWEMGYSPYGPPGRPREQVGHQPYPACFYLMKQNEVGGGFTVVEMVQAADENQAANLMSRGFRQGRHVAEAYVVEQAQARAVGAAERNASDRRMSEKAKAESEAAQAQSVDHMPEIPVTPIKRRGRPVKVAS